MEPSIHILHTKLSTERSDRFLLSIDGINAGKCIIEKQRGNMWLKYIEIYEKYRGNDYSTKLWNFVENWLKNQQIKVIYLCTMEFADKPGKLVKLYTNWGFTILNTSGEKYEYNGDELIRKVVMVKYL